MAKYLLSEEEFQFITGLKKDLLEKAKTASPRAAAAYKAVSTQLGNTIARETGTRAAAAEKDAARAALQALKLQMQQERLAKMQEKMKEPGKPADQNAGRERPKANA